MSNSEFSADAVRKHQETVVGALKVRSQTDSVCVYFTGHCDRLGEMFCNISFLYYFQTERDVSVRQRAVDLLYAMCDKNNAEEIVSEMLTYLETADYSIKEEMVNQFIFGS